MDFCCRLPTDYHEACREAAALDLLDCLARPLAAQVAWDDRVDHSEADLEDPAVDSRCVCPVEPEVLDPVDQVAAGRRADEVLNRHRLDSRRIRKGVMNGGKHDCAPRLRAVIFPIAL